MTRPGIKIIPALIAKTQDELVGLIRQVEPYAEIAQIDVMDGVFVPNSSNDFDFTLPATSLHFEAHLMVNDPKSWIEKNAAKVETILAHIESCREPEEILRLTKELRKKIGLVLNPETPLESVRPYLQLLDQVLIMTVNPGFYGSPFLPEALYKVRRLRELMPGLDIEVDGGIVPDNIRQAYDAGANLFVSGSYIVKAADPKKAIGTLRAKVIGTGPQRGPAATK